MENKTERSDLNTNENAKLKSKEVYLDELEGIVTNEPKFNKYETIKFHKLNVFPYFLIGKVVTKFNFDGVYKYLNGVGILIGPHIVLTVAHNLCHMVSKDKILTTKKICFFPAANGDFNLFDPVKTDKFYFPEAYINSLITEDRDQQLYNDWGLIYLNSNVGDNITTMLDIEKNSNLNVNNGIYNFFENNENLNLNSISKQTKSEKISIIGYTELKDNCVNNTAYKFANNFIKNLDEQQKDEDKDKLDINQLNDKKININININTSGPESITEGLVTGNRYFPKKASNKIVGSLNGLDYIIFGNEDFNKEFDITDKDKLIMCESQGNLKNINNDNIINCNNSNTKAIHYQISTYKGQSGSPLFLRIKKLSEKDNNGNKSKPSYFYQFIGLHSRRGPSTGEFYESDKMNNLTEYLMTTKINDINLINQKLLQLKDGNSMQTISKYDENELIKINGVCDYNMALSIMGETIKNIKEQCKINESQPNYDFDYSNLKSEFILGKIYLNDKIKLSGLFKRNNPLSILFTFGSEILKVPNEYVLLREITNSEISTIQNFNFDKDKKISEIMDNVDDQISISFELMLNIKKYGEYMSDKILNKFMENYDLELSQLKAEFKNKYMKPLFHSIFAEINMFDSSHLTYGKLFKKIRKTILTKLDIPH